MGELEVMQAAMAAREASERWREQEMEGSPEEPRYRFRIEFEATKDVATRILSLVLTLDTSARTYSGPPLELIPNTGRG